MALGSWSAEVDFSESMKAELFRPDGNPRKLWALVYDSNDLLVYPPLPLLSGKCGKEKIELGGTSILWDLGIQGIGPTIDEREYLSGTNKLDNPVFALDPPDIYWRRAAEGGLWTIATGIASNVGGFGGDDTLEYDRKFYARPGQAFRAGAIAVSGIGRLRVRIIFEGQFNPPNLWPNGDLAAGGSGWSGSIYAAVVNDPANSYGASGNVIRCLPIPKASWTDNFEGGSSWTDVTTPAPMSDDIDIVYDPAQAHDGGWVMRVGPVTQHQLLTNADFGQGFAYWFQSSTDAEPHNVWELWPGDGVNGSDGVKTTGYATAGRPGPETIKYLRADASDGGGIETYDVIPGDQFRAEAYWAGAPGTEGYVYISVMIPHPTVPGHDIWWVSNELHAPPNDQWQWHVTTIENITIPANRFDLNALAEVHNHGLGHWKLDHYTVTRTRGNRAKIVSDTLISMEVGTDYEVSALMRNGDDMQVGNVRVGIQLEGAGMEAQTEGEDKSSTDFVWDRAARVVRPAEGYTGGRFFVAAQDVIGSMWVDTFTLIQLNNNRTSITGSTFPLTPERTYTVSCRFHSGAALDGGNIRIDVRLTRAGYPDVVVPSPVQDGTGGERRLLEFSLTPPSGYDMGQGVVTFTDVSGDNFYAGEFRVVDNDTGTVVYDATSDSPILASPFVDATAPDGTEFVRVAMVAEQGSTSWSLLGASLTRTGITPATGDDIIADLLVHPSTGLPMGIAPGTINCPEPIPFDWRQIKMTPLAALVHYGDVISEPTREYRLNPAIPPTIDVSTSPFVVRPIVLLPHDIDVEEVSAPTADVTNRATEIEVIGAEVPTLSGETVLITAKATVPGDVERDINNNPIVRTRPVSDATIDTFGYARAYAEDQALREAVPGLVVDATLTGTPYQRGAYDVGDWLEVYKPESNIEDTSNPKTVEGVPVFPKVLRVVAREREHGPQFRVVMLRPNGSTFDLPVNHSERDATKLTLAERRLFDWEADPDGGATGQQYLRDRAGKPR